MIKSHIYLAKSILNRFSYIDKDKRKLINYYDFSTKRIETSTTTSFNRKIGYYTDTNEEKLKTFSEEKIGNVINYLEAKYNDESKKNSISSKMKNVIRRYVAYQLIRDDSMMEIIKEYMSNINYNANFLSNEERFRRVLLIKQYKTLDIQQLKKNFVLTSSTSALFPYSPGYFMMNITLTPKISITLCNKKTLQDVMNTDDDIYFSTIYDDNFVLKYNQELYEVAKKNKPNILVGYKKDLVDIIKKEE